MDDDAGDDQEIAPIGHARTTSSYDIYMVDTPKGSDNEDQRGAAEDNPADKQPKRRRRRRPKSRLDKNSTPNDPAIEQGKPVDDEHATKQPSEQDESDNQSVPSENNSPDDLTPDTPPEHKNLHGRLVATARSLKKEKRKLKTAEDILRMRWSKVLKIADKYGNGHQSKSYPKRKLLPEFDEEAIEPPQSKSKEAAWPDR